MFFWSTKTRFGIVLNFGTPTFVVTKSEDVGGIVLTLEAILITEMAPFLESWESPAAVCLCPLCIPDVNLIQQKLNGSCS